MGLKEGIVLLAVLALLLPIHFTIAVESSEAGRTDVNAFNCYLPFNSDYVLGSSDECSDVLNGDNDPLMEEQYDIIDGVGGQGDPLVNGGFDKKGGEEPKEPKTGPDIIPPTTPLQQSTNPVTATQSYSQTHPTPDCTLQYKRPGGHNSYSCEKMSPDTSCIWVEADKRECYDNRIDGDFTCEKDDLYKAYSGGCDICLERREYIDGNCYLTSQATNCVQRQTKLCDCYDPSDTDCNNDIVKACGNCNQQTCIEGYHRQTYNSMTCGEYILTDEACVFTPVSDISKCLGIEGTDSCYDDPIKIEYGNCIMCSVSYKRSAVNAFDCQVRNVELECEWTTETDLEKCLGVMGTGDCIDPIYSLYNSACNIQDQDGDGVSDKYDICKNTPSSEIPGKDGCSCSQKFCNDNNQCTQDTCKNGVCIYNNNDGASCGLSRACPNDVCDIKYPYKMLDYPASGNDYCRNGQCISYSCEIISAYYSPACLVEQESEPEICDGKDNDNNNRIDDSLTAPYCSKQFGVCAGSKKTCGGISGWIDCAGKDYSSSYAEDENANNCDSLDNDCDGTIDEGCVCTSGQTRKCGDAVGICQQGIQSCINNKWQECLGGAKPSIEICDGKDNDCDGLIDEDVANSKSYSLTEDCNINSCLGEKECTASGIGQCKLFKDNDDDSVCLPLDNCPEIFNPLQEDTDKDGIGNACDICPLDALSDIDKDNVCGNLDNCPNAYNPDQKDSDSDGTGDACDICPMDRDNDKDSDSRCADLDNCLQKYNPGQEDCDNDGIGDACDTFSYCSTDSDNDNVKDINDNCPLLKNPDQKDSDRDGIGDACDPCMFDSYNDIDKDGTCANNDNCPLVNNPDQSDIDNDKIGDICDGCIYDPLNDIDADNICGNIDNCANIFNPSQSDCDQDNIGNACDKESPCSYDSDKDSVPDMLDNCPDITNTDQADKDNDGIGDACDPCINDPFNDADKDGACGDADNCPNIINHDQSDMDNDGTGDKCDICQKDAKNDLDQDGTCGDVDNCPYKSNPSQRDCDSNGIGDACDGKSTCTSDTDKDNALDNIDNCPELYNAGQMDKDGDGIGDACDPCMNDPFNDADHDGICADIDNCQSISNPNQADSDNDGFGDSCDKCPIDGENDFDKDGICGGYDNCRYRFNPDQEDCDNNSIGDACDKDSSCVRDKDGDLLIDYKDNCPNINNPDQTDSDNDGIGDACDRCILDKRNDYDYDGICGSLDNCPLIYNSNQLDSDKDGIGDACDLCPNDPNNDIDEDGLCADIDTCPQINNPKQEAECAAGAKEKYDKEIKLSVNSTDVQGMIEDAYGAIPNFSKADIQNNIDAFKNKISVEKKEYMVDGRLFTKYKISINTDKPLANLAYYQKLPKCLAQRTDNIYFNGKNYNIIERDPIIAWHFAEVAKNIELTYDVEGSIPDTCLEELKGFAYSTTEESKSSPIGFIVPLIVIIAIIFLILILEKPKDKDAIEEIIESKVKEVREKYAGLPDDEIKEKLVEEGINQEYIKKIMKKL